MSDLDPDLRAALTAERDVPPRRPASWDDVIERGRRRQTRHRLEAATAALAVAAVVATSFAVFAGDDKPADGGFVAPPTPTPTASTSPRPESTEVPIVQDQLTIRSADGGRRLVAAISCGPDDRWLARVTEVGADLEFELREARAGETATACTGDVFGGAVTVTLTQPLGGRRVLDTRGRAVVVLDSHELLIPTYLPQPFQVEDRREEQPLPGSWSFVYTKGDFGVSVHAYGSALRPTECEQPDPVTVRGIRGRACGTTVSWEEGGYLRQVYIGAFESSSDTMPYTVQDALRVAESLRPME